MANWYKGKDQNETVIFIPATPRSELKRRMKEVLDRAEVKIAIAEVQGRNIKQILQRSCLSEALNVEMLMNVLYVEIVRVEDAGQTE